MDEAPYPEEFRSRFSAASGNLIDSKYVLELLTRLSELKRITDPASGPLATKQKDFNAFTALKIAGKLVDAVAGWATDHVVGKALAGERLVARQPSGNKDHPDYRRRLAESETHDYERSGGKSYCRFDFNPEIAKLALLNLIKANPGGFPLGISKMVGEAIEGLYFGELLPILSPTVGHRKAKLRELRLQLSAIVLVEYRVARGIKKYEALHRVAEHYGQSSETLKTWGRRVRKELGDLEVSEAVARARNSASHVNAGEEQDLIDISEELYGSQALKEYSSRYRLLRRSS